MEKEGGVGDKNERTDRSNNGEHSPGHKQWFKGFIWA